MIIICQGSKNKGTISDISKHLDTFKKERICSYSIFYKTDLNLQILNILTFHFISPV